MKKAKNIFGTLAGALTASLAVSLTAGFALVGCSESGDGSVSANGGEGYVVKTITAYLPGNDGKSLKKAAFDGGNLTTVATTYVDNDDEIKVSWEDDDQFNVSNGTSSVLFHVNDIDDADVATFYGEGEIPCSESAPCHAIYPHLISDTTDAGIKEYLLAMSDWNASNYRIIDVQNGKFDNLWKQNVMTSEVTKDGNAYVVQFKHKVALVDISITFGEAVSIEEVGIYGPRGEKYITGIASGSGNASYSATETLQAVVAVPPFALQNKDNLTVFVTDANEKTIKYKRKLKKDVSLEAGKYYPLAFAASDKAPEHLYIEGVEVVDLGHCGYWAKEDFAKNGRPLFVNTSQSSGNATNVDCGNNCVYVDSIYQVKNLGDSLMNPGILTGLTKWKLPTKNDFDGLVDCEVPGSDHLGITQFVSSSDTIYLGKAITAASLKTNNGVGGFWLAENYNDSLYYFNYGFVGYDDGLNSIYGWKRNSTYSLNQTHTHRIHLIPANSEQLEFDPEQPTPESPSNTCGNATYDPDTQICHEGKVFGQLVDSRDNQVYRTVTIGNETDGYQTWMAENLNYEYNNGTAKSYCYDNSADSCAKYGRLYTWDAAMQACPEGWHVPTNDEYNTLYTNIGGTENAGTHLKSASGWNNSGNGNDTYGFSVLPTGTRGNNGNFASVGQNSVLWSASESKSSYAYAQFFNYRNANVSQNEYKKIGGFSLRCLQDSN